MPLPDDVGSKHDRVAGRVECLMLQRWTGEATIDSPSLWLSLYDAPQISRALRVSELHSWLKMIDKCISKNTSLPIRDSNTTKQDPSLQKTPAIKPPPTLPDSSTLHAVKRIEAERVRLSILLLYGLIPTSETCSYRTHGTERTSNQSKITQHKSTSAKTGKRKQTEQDKKATSDNDDEGGPERNKQPRTKMRNLANLGSDFACPLEKGDDRFGQAACCRDFSSKDIDTVIRVCPQCLDGDP